MRTIPLLAAAAAALLLAGCASTQSGTSTESAPQPLPAVEQGSPDVASTSGADGADASQPAVDADAQSVIVTGWVSIVAEAPVEAADAAADLATAAGGSVAARSESAGVDDVPERAELTLRVPADAVDRLLDDLRGVGDVRTVDVSSVDVSQQVQDLDVRVVSTRASVDRLTSLLATAADTETLLEIEGQLTIRTSELESLLAQQTTLADQVASSTITVSIASVAIAPEEPPTTFVDGLAAGWGSLTDAAAAVAVGAGAALPWLAVLAIPVAALIVVARRRRSRLSPSAPSAGDSTSLLA